MKHSNENLSNKGRAAKFILKNGGASKPEIASNLELSMPTVLQIVKSLLDDGIISESGKQKSNGGRKAASLIVDENFRYAVGIDVTSNHLSYVLTNLRGDIAARKRVKLAFENSRSYYDKAGEILSDFLTENATDKKKITGVGISLPGIIDRQNEILLRSHILKQNNVSLKGFAQAIPFETAFENDANSALFAEMSYIERNTVYLSLSNSVGGSICIDDGIYGGNGFKSAEFGHMIIVPNGRKCYCGKLGCADAYCSANVLLEYTDTLEDFFTRLENGEPTIEQAWNKYLDYLSILISNLRMAFDCDIMLGGYVGGFLGKYMEELAERVSAYDMFENGAQYLRSCKYQKEASAVGAAMYFNQRFFDTL